MKEKLSNVSYEKCKLVAKKEDVYTTDGKFMFSVSFTDRAKELIDDKDWDKKKESWLEYRKRVEAELEIENQKRYKLAADLAEAFNKMHNNPTNSDSTIGWISVNERLPEHDNNVLAVLNGEVCIMSCCFIPDIVGIVREWAYVYDGIDGGAMHDDDYHPTHWMEIPLPPVS